MDAAVATAATAPLPSSTRDHRDQEETRSPFAASARALLPLLSLAGASLSAKALPVADAVRARLRFRVVQLRLWGSDQLDGFQFVYRDYASGDEQESPLVATARVTARVPRPPPVEIDLVEDEFIIRVDAVTATAVATDPTSSSPCDGRVAALVVATSTGRRFRVGALTVDDDDAGDAAVRIDLSSEVRGLDAELRAAKDAFIRVTPATETLPTANALQSEVASALAAPHASEKQDPTTAAGAVVALAALQTLLQAVATVVDGGVQATIGMFQDRAKAACPEDCKRLALLLSDVHRGLQGVLARGVVRPVGALAAFAEVVQLSIAALRSAAESNWTDYFVRREPVIAEYIARLERLKMWLDDRVPQAELSCLGVGDAVSRPLDRTTVPRMVRQALQEPQLPLAVELCVKYARCLTTEGYLVHSLVEKLVDSEMSVQIPRVVEAHASASKKRVATVMAPYKTRRPTLVEKAVHWAKPLLLEWLVSEARIDPFDTGESQLVAMTDDDDATESWDEKTTQRQAQYEQLLSMLEAVQDDEARVRMWTLLTQMKHKEDFQIGLVTLANKDDVTPKAFYALVPKITSVYDLPLLYSQGKSHFGDDKHGFTMLIKATCAHVTASKLVMDTKASAFFNVALRQAYERGYLTALEHEEFRIINSQVNMESAAWVQELKRTTDQVQWRVNRLDDQVEALTRNVRDLRESLRRKEADDQRRRRCRRNVALMSSMLSMVGGNVLPALQDVFDHAEPTLLIAASEDDFAMDFEGADMIAALLGGYAGKDTTTVYGSSTSGVPYLPAMEPHDEAEDDGDGDLRLDVLRALRDANMVPAAVFDMLATAAELSRPPSTTHGRHVSVDERQIKQHPYHDAVRESHGSLHAFVAIEAAQCRCADVNDTFPVTVKKVQADGSSTTKTTPMPAYMYASHLGYAEIVDHLLMNRRLKKCEWKYTTRRRARKTPGRSHAAAVSA